MRRTTVTRKCSKKTGRNLKSSIRKISNLNISLVSKRTLEIELDFESLPQAISHSQFSICRLLPDLE